VIKPKRIRKPKATVVASDPLDVSINSDKDDVIKPKRIHQPKATVVASDPLGVSINSDKDDVIKPKRIRKSKAKPLQVDAIDAGGLLDLSMLAQSEQSVQSVQSAQTDAQAQTSDVPIESCSSKRAASDLSVVDSVESSAKRSKPRPPPRQMWTADLVSPSALKNVLGLANDLGGMVRLQIMDAKQTVYPGFTGVVAESIDREGKCMMISFMDASVDIFPDAPPLNVNVQSDTLLQCIGCAGTCMSIRVMCHNDTELTVRVSDGTIDSTYVLPTVVPDAPQLVFDMMQFQYAIEFDVAMLKTSIKAARALKCECIAVSVIETRDTNDTSKVGKVVCKLTADGQVCSSHEFTIIRANDSITAGPGYVGLFSVKRLEHIVHCLNCRLLTVRVAHDLPMLIGSSMGSSSINVLLDTV
jgi:hypothetical protein